MILALLIFATISDIKKRIIPNVVPLGIALVTLSKFMFILLSNGDIGTLQEVFFLIEQNLLGFLAALLLCLISKAMAGEGFGMGDIKLLISLGLYLGVDIFLRTVLVVSILAFLVGLIFIVFKHADKKTTLPFAPFIFCGVFLIKIIEIVSEVNQ